MKSKEMKVSEALDLIKDGDTIAISAVGVVGYPEYVVTSLKARFIESGSPKGLTVYAGGGHGGRGEICDTHFALKGFMTRYVCTHPRSNVKIRDMIVNEELEAYALPQGVINQLYRCVAAKQPGLLTKIGIGTYVDPRQDGGKLNGITHEDLVRVMDIDGEEWLYYMARPVTVAIIRGTFADEYGNVSIEREALKLEMLEVALAAKACKGKVIVQVEHLVENGSIKAKDVVVPGELVDAVVVVENPEVNHKYSNMPLYNPFLTGEARSPRVTLQPPPEVLSPKDIICRRAVYEFYPDALINLGLGAGAGAGEVAMLEGAKVTFTLELGVFGGTPCSQVNFGVTMNPVSFVSPPAMFDFYHGGGLDITVLGAAEVDKDGNVNTSKFGGQPNGHGGFIDISQSSKKVVFGVLMTAKGMEAEISDGKLNIKKDGQIPKFVDQVEQITFNGKVSVASGQEAVYITERAVFKLGKDGLILTEIAPGVDLEKDVLSQMGFRPIISEDLKLMDERIFIPGRMGCFD